MTNIEILSEDAMTQENLSSIFKQAFMEVTPRDDYSLFVTYDDMRVLVTIDPRRKLLAFGKFFSFRDSAAMEARQALVAIMNKASVFADSIFLTATRTR